MATYLRPNRSKERILLFEVNKNEEYLEKARKKVEKSRIFLQDFTKKMKSLWLILKDVLIWKKHSIKIIIKK